MPSLKENLLQKALIIGAFALTAATVSGCSGGGTQKVQPTPQGTISLDAVKVGMPESTFKDAILTFVVDPDPRSSTDGRTQYLSRTRDANGGQFVVVCKGGSAQRLSVYHMDKPIARDAAEATMKNLFPADLPTAPKADESQLSKSGLVEYNFGSGYKGQMLCDKTGSQVKIIIAEMQPKAAE